MHKHGAPLLNRREFLGRLGFASAGLAVGAGFLQRVDTLAAVDREGVAASRAGAEALAPPPRRYREFAGPAGDLPGLVAGDSPGWRIRIDGLVDRVSEFAVADLVALLPVERRVTGASVAASAALPWDGFPLAALVRWARPHRSARYLRVVSYIRPDLAPGQRRASGTPWPYREALSLEDALDDRAFVATGLCGRELSPLHGAPLRLVLPWKQGHKCAKGIVRFEFAAVEPATFPGELAPRTGAARNAVSIPSAPPDDGATGSVTGRGLRSGSGSRTT